MNNPKTNQRRINKARPRRNRRVNVNDGNTALPNQQLSLPRFRNLDLIIPDKLFTKLKYTGVSVFTVPIGSQFVAKRWRPTSAFDVDPLLGGTSMPGFAELSAMYGTYRVIASSFKIESCSQDSRSGSQVVIPLNVDPGSTPTAAVISSWQGQPYSKWQTISGSGAHPNIVDMRMSTEKIYGSKAVYFDDNFSSIVTASPTNNWFWALAIEAGVIVAGSNFVVNSLITITLDVEFYDRVSLQT